MSTNLTSEPQLFIADTVGIAVFETVITSSPCPIPSPSSAIKIASVPLPTETPYLKL